MVLLCVRRVRNDGVGLVVILLLLVVVVAELLPCAQMFAVRRSPHARTRAGNGPSAAAPPKAPTRIEHASLTSR